MAEEKDLKVRLKEFLIEELSLEETVDEIEDGEPLMGPEGLGLDSVDALQIVVGLEKHFGLKIADAEKAKEVLVSVDTMATAVAAVEV